MRATRTPWKVRAWLSCSDTLAPTDATELRADHIGGGGHEHCQGDHRGSDEPNCEQVRRQRAGERA
jgi:hypothetical protein